MRIADTFFGSVNGVSFFFGGLDSYLMSLIINGICL